MSITVKGRPLKGRLIITNPAHETNKTSKSRSKPSPAPIETVSIETVSTDAAPIEADPTPSEPALVALAPTEPAPTVTASSPVSTAQVSTAQVSTAQVSTASVLTAPVVSEPPAPPVTPPPQPVTEVSAQSVSQPGIEGQRVLDQSDLLIDLGYDVGEVVRLLCTVPAVQVVAAHTVGGSSTVADLMRSLSRTSYGLRLGRDSAGSPRGRAFVYWIDGLGAELENGDPLLRPY